MTIFAMMVCALVSGQIDPSSCQEVAPVNSVAECRQAIADQTRGVDLSHADTKLVCMKRAVATWSPVD